MCLMWFYIFYSVVFLFNLIQFQEYKVLFDFRCTGIWFFNIYLFLKFSLQNQFCCKLS